MAKRGSWARVAECIYRRGNTYQVRLNNPATGKKETFGPAEGVVDRESAFRVRDEQRAKQSRFKRRGGNRDETIAEFVARWMADFGGRRAKTTSMHYEQQIQPFLGQDAAVLDPDEFVEGTTVGELRPRDFTRKMARKYSQLQPSRMKTVSAMFGDMMEDELLDANPFHRLGVRRRNGRKELVAITREELALLAECARREHSDPDPGYGEMFETMVLTAAWTGVRPAELFVLRWPDVDWENDSIFVRRSYRSKSKELVDYTKSGDQREIILPAPLREPLWRLYLRRDRDDWREGRSGPGKHDLFATKTGQQFYAVVFQYYWNPVRTAFKARMEERDPGRAHLLFERADGTAKPMDFYELRHFCATFFLERGVPAHQVAVQLGHNDNGALVIETYGHPSKDAARAALRAAAGV